MSPLTRRNPDFEVLSEILFGRKETQRVHFVEDLESDARLQDLIVAITKFAT